MYLAEQAGWGELTALIMMKQKAGSPYENFIWEQ